MSTRNEQLSELDPAGERYENRSDQTVLSVS